MNELIFFSHLFLVIGLILFALRLGKEALITCFVLQVIIGNLFVIKQITLFGLQITCCDVFIIGSTLVLQFLQEHFGRDLVKKTTWIGFFGMLFFGTMALMHLAYRPSAFDTTHSAFSLILSKSPRILLASFTCYFIVQRLEIFFFGYLRSRFPQSAFIWRSGLSFLPAQALDTILFTYLALWGILQNLGSIMLVSFVIKMLIFAIISPFTLLSKKIVRA
ncbi:MAG TPA: queuosine precursor transporter [Chlamydiales bacterium]|nr:queuosine precursor transporter [Chlamydiales bacterium]